MIYCSIVVVVAEIALDIHCKDFKCSSRGPRDADGDHYDDYDGRNLTVD